MSFIHLDKSIVTFHFKEILEDGHFGGPLTLFSLGALVFGPKLLVTMTAMASPTTRSGQPSASTYRPQMSLAAWVAMQAEQNRAAQAADVQAAGLPLHLVSEQQDNAAA